MPLFLFFRLFVSLVVLRSMTDSSSLGGGEGGGVVGLFILSSLGKGESGGVVGLFVLCLQKRVCG